VTSLLHPTAVPSPRTDRPDNDRATARTRPDGSEKAPYAEAVRPDSPKDSERTRPDDSDNPSYADTVRPDTHPYGQADRNKRTSRKDRARSRATEAELRRLRRDEAAQHKAESRGARRGRASAWLRHVALLVPLVLVNGVAIWGQAAWAYEHIARNLIIAVGFAAALETIGIYLAVEAHSALMNDDSAFKLRAGSYLVAGLAGALNYAHFANPGYRPTPIALAFGVLSTLSPWLWAIRSRSLHRADLAARGLIDKRAVKFPAVQWILYPIRTFRAFRVSVWAGINHPAQARAFLLERDALHHMGAVEAVRYAYGALGVVDPHTARVWLSVRGVRVSQANIDEANGGRPVAPPPMSGSPLRASGSVSAPTIETYAVSGSLSGPVPALSGPVSGPTGEAYGSGDSVSGPVSSPPAPVSGAPADASGSADWARRDGHAARLETLTTKRDKIRYAYAALGSYDVTAAREWLSTFGVEVSRSEAHQVAKRGTGTTGEFVMVPAPAGE
jgi:hypothetical protein